MVSTPKTSNKNNKNTTPCDDSNNKVNMMSQYPGYVQCIDPASNGSKSGTYDSSAFYELYDMITGNDILTTNELFHPETSVYEFSPDLASSMTTPSLLLDGISTPQELNDSPLFNASFMSSPSLDPAMAFFPDLPNDTTTASTRSLMQLSSLPSLPSVTIPVDDAPLSNIPALSPALNIPWSTDVTGSTPIDNIRASSTSPSILSNFSDISSPTAVSSSTTSPITTSLRARSRKRTVNEIEKDPQVVADELALKRAKNTDAARRSRLRKARKMESLQKQVDELKSENTELHTRIAVLESEKKGLESKNSEKETRIKELVQQLAEAHEILIKRT